MWYTSMVGKKSSLKTLLKILNKEGITNVTSCFCATIVYNELYLYWSLIPCVSVSLCSRLLMLSSVDVLIVLLIYR